MGDLGLLILRLVTGGLLAGHGSQKLFGWFGGGGLRGAAGMMEALGLRPSDTWALLAGGSEFGSGLLTALGFLSPLGPIAMLAPMSTALATVHWGKPIWVTAGGGELPVTTMAVAAALALAGPGRYSLDGALGIRLPRALVALATIAVLGGIAFGLVTREAPAPPQPGSEAEPSRGEEEETPPASSAA